MKSICTGAAVCGVTLALLTSFRPHWTFDPLSALPRDWSTKLAAFRLSGLGRSPASDIDNPTHRGHSHNDFQQARPLEDALAHGFASVEADVRLRGGEIWVSHLGVLWPGTLRGLYLEPLKKRVEKLGSVRGDGHEFLLWLDLKQASPEMVSALQNLLSEYASILTRYDGPRRIAGPVSVIFTGSRIAKRRLVHDFASRYGCFDALKFTDADPAGASEWCWYSVKWFDEFAWDGEGEMPEGERAKLISFVARIHAKGRRVRFWENPDMPGMWQELAAAGVDLIGTDSVTLFDEYF